MNHLDAWIGPTARDSLLRRDQSGLAVDVGIWFDFGDGPVDGRALAAAMEMAARLGLECAGMRLPLAGPAARHDRRRVALTEIAGADAGALLQAAREWAAHGEMNGFPGGDASAGDASAGSVSAATTHDPAAAAEDPAAAAVAAAPAGWAIDHPWQGRPSLQPDMMTPLVVLPASLPAADACALVDAAARLGLACTGLVFPLTAMEPAGASATPREVVAAGGQGPGDARKPVRPGEFVAGVERLVTANGGLRPFNGAAVADASKPGAHAAAADRGLLLERTWELGWEVDRLLDLFERAGLPQIRREATVAIDFRLSEPRSRREAVAAELRRRVEAHGAKLERCRAASAYKGGWHWLEEEVGPALAALRQAGADIARVRIEAPRFEPGVTGGPPDAAANPCLDLPIRWLQEIYPGDEWLARALDLPLERMLALTDPGGDPQQPRAVLRLTALDAGGRTVFESDFEVRATRRPFFPGDPSLGVVHAPAGWLQVRVHGHVVLDEPVRTDPEAAWDVYQREVWPLLAEHLERAAGERPLHLAQPLFGGWEVEVELSEDDRPLPVRQEQISPLDALHEDLYFCTLDWIEAFARRRDGETPAADAPGPVIPLVRAARDGRNRLTVRLYDREFDREFHLEFDRAANPTNAARDWLPAGPIAPGDLPPLLGELGRVPGVEVVEAARSWQGRPIFAVEVVPPSLQGKTWFRAKLAALHPTCLVIARHHANEVSSTHAALSLARRLATNPALRPLRDALNVVFIPLENVDGAALHERLAAEHPRWKLHAARYNAAGREFGPSYFDPATPFTEARAVPNLWRSWLPDALVDNHGVPQQEWVQPFAGFGSPPRFRVSYWLPNALIYGIFRLPHAAERPEHAALIDVFRKHIAARLNADPEIAAANREWRRAFERYGRFAPEKFPLQLEGDFISYGWTVSPHVAARSFGARFPDLTPIDWVTEVPDETAQGQHLRDCARAHELANIAMLEFVAARAANNRPPAHAGQHPADSGDAPAGAVWPAGRSTAHPVRGGTWRRIDRRR